MPPAYAVDKELSGGRIVHQFQELIDLLGSRSAGIAHGDAEITHAQGLGAPLLVTRGLISQVE